MTQHQRMQAVIRQFKMETGTTEVDMGDVADWAIAHGWRLPKRIPPRDMLAKEFARAARDEMRHDDRTGRPYRANHAVPTTDQNGQTSFRWVDIDEAPRAPMLKSLMRRREQIISDGLQLSFDAEHWNRINPREQPIAIPLDFTEDVEERTSILDEGEQPIH